MIALHEQIWVERSPIEVFAYACEFAHCEQWDSTASSSVKTSQGPTQVGTEYRVVCDLPVGSITLRYRVVQWEAPNRVVLEGRCHWFTVRDTITVTEHSGGTRLDYDAVFNFKYGLSRLEGRLQEGFETMGKASVDGLKEALEDRYTAPPLRDTVRRGDRYIVPGLSRFTRLGYRQRKQQFYPLSAYMGDKHILLTGATSGIGLAAARELADMGASLTLVARDEQRGKQVLDRIQRDTGNDRLSLELADMSLMQDVRALVQRLQAQGRGIDVLINNAGALFNPRQETSEGLEKSLALLFLGPCLLTEGVLPLMQGRGDARVVNVVSGGMYTQKLDLEQLQGESGRYSGSVAYARAKRALMVQTERWGSAWEGTGVVCNAMHPGWADTPGVRQALPGFYRATRGLLRSSEQGADTVVWLAAATEAGTVSGQLFLDREPHEAHWLKRTHESTPERTALGVYVNAIETRFS
jgi:dehydrogenase/reductase SDR family protein 12